MSLLDATFEGETSQPNGLGELLTFEFHMHQWVQRSLLVRDKSAALLAAVDVTHNVRLQRLVDYYIASWFMLEL